MCCWDTETLTLFYTIISFFLQTYSRPGSKNPYPIPFELFPRRNFIAILVQHTLTTPSNILQSYLQGFHFFYITMGKEPYSKLNYFCTSHFPSKLYCILDQNCLIFYSKLNCLKSIPITAAHTSIVCIWEYHPDKMSITQQLTYTLYSFGQI